MYSAWPTTTNATSALAGLSVPAHISLADQLESAIDGFERDTGYQPFLAEATESDIKFSNYLPSGEHIQFPTGYATVTALYADASYEADGTLLVPGRDYLLMPTNGSPIEGAQLTRPRRFAQYSLRVVGRRGFGTSIPADAWQAVLGKALQQVYQHADAAMGPAKRIRQGPVEVEYAVFATNPSGFYGRAAAAEEAYQAAVNKYRRLTF